MEDGKSIVFKGNSEGLVIVIPEDYETTQIFSEVESKVSAAARFFKGARIKVSYRGARLSEAEEEILKGILDEKSGAIIEAFSREDEIKQPVMPAPKPPAQARKFFQSLDEGSCKFVKNTIRGGTRVQFDGSIVVIGDVNPGGEIIASGNVVVLGALRGMVHAGADGNKEAFIYALNLKPTQIRIAEVIARRPDEPEDSKICPEIASVKDGAIVVDAV